MINLDSRTYDGPRWTYGGTLRPISIWTVPKDFILFSQRNHRRFPDYGTVDYPRRLTDEEASHFALVLIGEGKE